MKKIVNFLILMFVASICAFAQPVYEESPSFPPDLDFSFLKEKFIVSVPNSLGRFEYQNMAGDFLTNKEVKNKVEMSKTSISFCNNINDKAGTMAVFEDFGAPVMLRYTLDQFVGVRFALFIYSTKKSGGTAVFKDFQIDLL